MLGGRQQNFDGWYATFHVQVDKLNWKNLKGYLGFKDAEKAEIDVRTGSKYNFTCNLLK